MAKPYYTSDQLIDAVKRKISFPIAQNTFLEEDILAFANEEMVINQVPSIMQYHENFFAYEDEIDIVEGVKKYPIPDRAIGMRLKDVHFKDVNGNKFEMSQVDKSDVVFYNGLTDISKFYIEGNYIVLVVNDVKKSLGKMVMTYYFRPNQLVRDERAAISTNFAKVVYVDGSGTITIDGVDYTGTIEELKDSIPLTTFISGDNLIITYKDRKTSFSSDDFDVTKDSLQFDKIPSHFQKGLLIDFIKTSGGHNVLSYDVEIAEEPITFYNIVTFEKDSIPQDFLLGDYICEQMECIIPQIPDDLHVALAERTGQQVLASMGATSEAKDMNGKLKDIEHRQGTLLDNRSESSPQKVSIRHTHLKLKRKRGFRRW